MIGGFDVAVIGKTCLEDVVSLLRVARREWEHAVVEVGGSDETMPIADAIKKPSSLTNEFFIYENWVAHESWTELGLTDENADQVISVIVEKDGISFVVDTPDSASGKIVEKMKERFEGARKILFYPMPHLAREPMEEAFSKLDLEVDETLAAMAQRPAMFGNADAIELACLTMLRLVECLRSDPRDLSPAGSLHLAFRQARYPKCGSRTLSDSLLSTGLSDAEAGRLVAEFYIAWKASLR
jgi:hypothetical protein